MDELAKFDETEICFATASDREAMNVLFDKSSAIGLGSRWLLRVAREGGLPEISHPLTSSSLSAIFSHGGAKQNGDTLGWPWVIEGLSV